MYRVNFVVIEFFMTHSYSISGMTCRNCVDKVKSELLKVGDISEAAVQLASPQATISMQKHIPLSVLQQALDKAGKFHISSIGQSEMYSSEAQENSTGWKAYWPLILVCSFVTGISIITAVNESGFHLMNGMNNFMGGTFIAFSFFKLLDLKGFAESYSTYDLLAARQKEYGKIYPFIELALGVAYIVRWELIATNIATIIIMGFSSIGVINSVSQKRKIKCACLGTVFNLPMTTVTIVENILMVLMAVVMTLMLLT